MGPCSTPIELVQGCGLGVVQFRGYVRLSAHRSACIHPLKMHNIPTELIGDSSPDVHDV